MYKSFRVKNFRCFKDFSIDNLEQINLIAGANNVGKTALLEAIFLHAGGTNIENTIRLNHLRGQRILKGSDHIWGPLFYRYDCETAIEIIGEDADGQVRTVRLKCVQPDSETIQWSQLAHAETGVMPTASTSMGLELEQESCGTRKVFRAIPTADGIKLEPRPDALLVPHRFFGARQRPDTFEEVEHYGHLELHKQADTILGFLQIIEPRLKRLSVIVTGGVPTLHGDIGLGRLIPLTFMGDGMRRLASWAIAIANASGGVVLIDEIENGIHHSIMTEVWLGMAELARRFNVQIFAATHSYEFIRTVHQAIQKFGTYELRLYRLDRRMDKIKVATFNEETLEFAIDANWEVR